MIKNLLNADEDPPPGTKVIIEETVINPPIEGLSNETSLSNEATENFETRPVFEIPESAKFFTKATENAVEESPVDEVSEPNIEPIIESAKDESGNLETPQVEVVDSSNTAQINGEKTKNDSAPTIFQSEYKPETAGETIRQSGLAYSAAIVLFASIVFMLVLGWFADLLLGSSPWGIVGGIILGAIIGFVQLFRITSQIFKK
ncbi:MAG: AtpZ/AtpI family protein [Actinomycetota bacterium]